MAEYAESAEFAMCAREGQLWIDLRLWNDEATLIVGVPVRTLMNAAIREAYQNIGADPSAQEFVSLVFNLGKDINRLASNTPASKQVA